MGGLLGVVYLTGNILLFPKLGSVQTVIMPVLGQIIAGLVIDNFGLFYSPISHLTGIRLAGALLVLCGVIITVAGKGWIDARHNKIDKQTENDNKQYGLWLWRIAGIVTGVLSAMQTAINGHLGTVLHSSVHAAFVSFLVGTVCLIIIVAIMRLPLKIDKTNSTSNPWWMWMGGIIGALFVLGNVVMVPLVGTGLAVVIVLVGLMIGSLLIDQFGWLESPRNPIAVIQIIGILIMIIGVGFIRIF
ncbi:DMT family transporter [Paucilactobacillus suebicus]|uniref:DMT family transporter n=1 Tax=Paucilactobacillus suebicus TaxID=152335 RepID=UPI00031C5DA6|nr:DMT family transporter [Paucilactobacillus suebicus]